jgi:hypothetical protein
MVSASGGSSPVGAAYIFEFGPSGELFEIAKLLPPVGDQSGFGSMIALEGDRALVGPHYSGNGVEILVLECDGMGLWSPVGALQIPSTISYNHVGPGLALKGDEAFVATRNGFLAYRRNAMGVWKLHLTSTHTAAAVADFGFQRPLIVAEGQVIEGCPDCLECFANGNGGFVAATRLRELMHGRPSASIASVGEQDLFLDFGLAGAGRFYFMLGSLTGTAPGIALPNSSDTLPLVFDAYTALMLDRPSLTVANAWGQLDELGRADAQFRVPSGLDPSFAGLVLHHAAVTLDVATGALEASNAVAVELVP